jgi:6-phosphogluconate dehydrogenase (decarboxylating)
LVLGASGGMGVSLTRELIGRNLEVVAFARNQAILEKLYGDLNTEKLIFEDVSGKKQSMMCVGRKMMFLAGLFNKDLKEMREMLYLREDPVILDGTKYEKEIGKIPKTSYETGIKETFHFLKNKL